MSGRAKSAAWEKKITKNTMDKQQRYLAMLQSVELGDPIAIAQYQAFIKSTYTLLEPQVATADKAIAMAKVEIAQIQAGNEAFHRERAEALSKFGAFNFREANVNMYYPAAAAAAGAGSETIYNVSTYGVLPPHLQQGHGLQLGFPVNESAAAAPLQYVQQARPRGNTTLSEAALRSAAAVAALTAQRLEPVAEAMYENSPEINAALNAAAAAAGAGGGAPAKPKPSMRKVKANAAAMNALTPDELISSIIVAADAAAITKTGSKAHKDLSDKYADLKNYLYKYPQHGIYIKDAIKSFIPIRKYRGYALTILTAMTT